MTSSTLTSMSSVEEGHLKTYDDISTSLTYTKRMSTNCSLKLDTEDPVDDSLEQDGYSFSFDDPSPISQVDETSSSSMKESYNVDSDWTDSDSHSPGLPVNSKTPSYNSDFTAEHSHSLSSEYVAYSGKYSHDSFCSDSQMLSSDTSRAYKSISESDSRSTSQSKSKSSIETNSSGDSRSSSASPSESVTQTTYREYSSEFSDSTRSDTGNDSRREEVYSGRQLQEQLAFINSANKVLQQKTLGDQKPKSLFSETWTTKIKRGSDALSESARNFIASRLTLLKDDNTEDMAKTNGITTKVYHSVSRHHCFGSVIERLRAENVIAGMKQKVSILEREIEDHQKFTSNGFPHQQISNFVLPRKHKLEHTTFASTLDDHQAKMNSVSMIGCIARDLPKPTQRPDILWEQLMNTAERRITSPTPPGDLL